MDLVGDERAQSIQVGAVLLFAVLIVAYSTYIAFVVPDQNREVEFNHNQQVQRDMIDVRNTLLETYTGGNDGYAEVALGTNFPARLAALNPPPPSGSLYTTPEEPITIRKNGPSGTEITDDACPGTNVGTRFLEYSPEYSVYDRAGTLRYESSFLVHDFGDSSVTLTDQTLVRGDRIQIIPITNGFNVGGSRTVAVEPQAGLLDTTEVSNPVVTLPTRASEQTWERLLDGEVDPSNVAVSGGEVTLTLSGAYTIECGPVGVGAVPPSGDRGGGVDEINPASPGDITLEDETFNKPTVTLKFNNTAGTNNITEARINFYDSQTGNTPTEGVIRKAGEADSATLQIGGQFKTLDPKIELAGDGAITNIEIRFNNSPNNKDWFILTAKLETGETALYFVSLS